MNDAVSVPNARKHDRRRRTPPYWLSIGTLALATAACDATGTSGNSGGFSPPASVVGLPGGGTAPASTTTTMPCGVFQAGCGPASITALSVVARKLRAAEAGTYDGVYSVAELAGPTVRLAVVRAGGESELSLAAGRSGHFLQIETPSASYECRTKVGTWLCYWFAAAPPIIAATVDSVATGYGEQSVLSDLDASLPRDLTISTMSLAGELLSCVNYSVNEVGNQETAYTICVTRDGILGFAKVDGTDGTSQISLRSLSRSVPSNLFEPPAQPI